MGAQRAAGGTGSLKELAFRVLARSNGGNGGGAWPENLVPRTPPPASTLGQAWDRKRVPCPAVPTFVPPAVPHAFLPAPPLPQACLGVSAEWREGVALLAALPPPGGITPARWAALAATSTYLLQSHGAELHRAGWDTLDLFGLHRRAPATNPAGWGLAWLLGAAGEVLDVAVNTVGMRRGPDGARLTFRRGCKAARAGVVPAWAILGDGDV